MSNEQYKAKTLVGLDPTSPAIGGLAPRTRMRWAPVGALYRAQDTVPATSRRIVASWSLSGANDWAQPNGSDDPGITDEVGSRGYPNGTWRTLGIHHARITPGCELRAHVLYCPAGLTQKQVTPDPITGNSYASDGAWGEFRVQATWTQTNVTSGADTDGPNNHSCTMEGSTKGTYGGFENTGAGQNWTDLREKEIDGIRPVEFLTDPNIAENFSEWSDVELTLQIRGGARLIAAIVYEVPRAHVSLHSTDALVSVHAMPASLSPQTSFPQTQAAAGTTYQEHRFGARRMAFVSERQSERLGPHVLSGSSWNESTTDVIADTENDPIAITSTSFVDIFDSSVTSYSDNNRGYIVAGSNAQLWRLCDSRLIARGRFAVIPVRFSVEATPAASGTAIVRLQSGPYEWVDVTIAGGGARAWFEGVGYLRSQVFADHNIANCQIFARTSAGTLNVRSWSVSFGQWA